MTLDPGVVATVGTALVALDVAAIGATIHNGRNAARAAENAEQAAEQSKAARSEARKAHRRLDRHTAEYEAAMTDGGPDLDEQGGEDGAD